jgi:hypothetical protein
MDNTGAPRFVIVWSLVKESGQWKLDKQISARRETEFQRDSFPTPTVPPTASPLISAAPSASGVPPASEENNLPSLPADGNQSGIYHIVDSLLRRDHPPEGFTSAADTQYTN